MYGQGPASTIPLPRVLGRRAANGIHGERSEPGPYPKLAGGDHAEHDGRHDLTNRRTEDEVEILPCVAGTETLGVLSRLVLAKAGEGGLSKAITRRDRRDLVVSPMSAIDQSDAGCAEFERIAGVSTDWISESCCQLQILLIARRRRLRISSLRNRRLPVVSNLRPARKPSKRSRGNRIRYQESTCW